MFEGVPSWPDASRFWQVVERHKVNIFYYRAHRDPRADGGRAG
jgi:acyl-coenzyme A synthetase/AMP-(fatty) acid ligase